jgi:hypothetical protein
MKTVTSRNAVSVLRPLVVYPYNKPLIPDTLFFSLQCPNVSSKAGNFYSSEQKLTAI